MLGRTSEAEWHSRVKQSPGAWGYIETPKWTGYFSAEELRRMEHPEEVGKYWQSVVETADRVLGYGKWRRRGESMLVDRDIYVGYGHAGYPVMMAYGAALVDAADAGGGDAGTPFSEGLSRGSR